MRIKVRMTRIAPLMIGMMLLVGCGSNDDPPPVPTATQAAVAPTNAVASACWSEDQRLTNFDYPRWAKAPEMTIDPAKAYVATMATSRGEVIIDLLPQEAPIAVNNFVCLASAGYFAGVTFHRIVPDFVIQAGDPTGTGSGGPGYTFADEPVTLPYEPGTLAMANAGPDTNGSQFFVVLAGGESKLQPLYSIFGRVTSGMDVVEEIGTTDPDTDPVTIASVTIAVR